MRIIVKNADFNVYGLNDITGLMEEITTNYGGISDTAPIEHFVKALGADGSNAIWGKIKALYMPVLSASTDGLNAFYDIIGKEKLNVTNAYTIEASRGVGPTNFGSSSGEFTKGGMTQDGASMFGLVTKSPRQSISSNAGILSILYNMKFNWSVSTVSVQDGTNTATINHTDGFTKPVAYALTAKESGGRTLFSKGQTKTNASLSATPDSFYVYAGSYCDISIFGMCEGLTSEEAAIIEAAIDTFVTEFGVLC